MMVGVLFKHFTCLLPGKDGRKNALFQSHLGHLGNS